MLNRTFAARGPRRAAAMASVTAAAVLALVPGLAASAQERDRALDPGTRIRLTIPCASPSPSMAPAGPGTCRIEGSLARMSGDTVALTTAGSPSRHALNAVRRLEVSRGRRSYWLVGAGAGLLVGGGVTYAVLHTGGSTALCDRSANQDAIGSGECLALTAGGALVGAGLGALVGSLIRTERWERVPLDRLRVGLGPAPRPGMSLAVALAF